MTEIQTDIQLFRAYLHAMRSAFLGLRAGGRVRGERGAVTPEHVILTAVFATGAIAIGAIIVTKFTGAARGIPTGP